METRDIISFYLAKNFKALYLTNADVYGYLKNSLDSDQDYFFILDKMVSEPEVFNTVNEDIYFPLFSFMKMGPVDISIDRVPLEILLINAFLLLSGWQEHTISKRDQHDRFPYAESLQYKFGFNLIPVVNLIFNEICRRLNNSGDHCTPLKFSEKGSNVIFSHDIDRLYSGWYEATGSLLKKPGLNKLAKWLKVSYVKFIRGMDDYQMGFIKLIGLLESMNINSIFFVLANKSNFDADYSLSDRFIKKMKQEIENHNHLVGIHGGYFTFRDPELARRQVEITEETFDKPVDCNRQHFLRFDMSKTPRVLFDAGIRHDFSLGFAESAGFRNSMATPFYLFDFNEFSPSPVIEVPLFFMDGSYSHYQKVGKGEMKNPLRELLPYWKNVHMNFAVLFHNSVFTDFKYAGFSELFVEMADFCRTRGYSTDAHVLWPATSLTT